MPVPAEDDGELPRLDSEDKGNVSEDERVDIQPLSYYGINSKIRRTRKGKTKNEGR